MTSPLTTWPAPAALELEQLLEALLFLLGEWSGGRSFLLSAEVGGKRSETICAALAEVAEASCISYVWF